MKKFLDDAMGLAVEGNATWLFRGQALSSWALASTYERFLLRVGASDPKLDDFQAGLSEFQASALRHGLIQASVDERTVCSIARHHGFPVPFIDWTMSPHVAMFFAILGRVENQIHQPKTPFRIYGVPLRNLGNADACGPPTDWVKNNFEFVFRPSHGGLTRAVRQFSHLSFRWPPSASYKNLMSWDVDATNWMVDMAKLRLSGVGAANLLEGLEAVALEASLDLQERIARKR